jgi:hypothetical protein
MAPARALLSAGQPRIRFVTRDLWERLITEAGQPPVAVTTDVLTILDGLRFRNIVRRHVLATTSDDLNDKVKLTKILRQAFEEAAVAGRLPIYICDPFWHGVDEWDPVDRACDSTCYHHCGWDVSHVMATCQLCWN